MPEINNNENSGLIRNVRKLVDRVQPLVVSNKSMTRKGQSTQENISSNLNKLLKEQQMANRIQLKTMFAQKESPYAKLHENTETTNELLKDLIDKKGEKKKGLFSNVWDSLKTDLTVAAPMLASALGASLAGAFTAKMFKDLGKNIADWIFEANKAELFQKRVTADAKRNMDERAEEMLEAGDLTKPAEEKVKQINQDIKTLIDQSRGTEKAGMIFLQKFNEIVLKPFEYAGGKILGMFVDEGENIVSNIRREILTDDFNKAKELGIYDRRLSEQENQARIDQYLMNVARERGTMFKTGDVVNNSNIEYVKPENDTLDMKQVKKMIQQREGFRTKAYPDTSKGYSIGYGSFTPYTKGQTFEDVKGKEITKEQANKLFMKDFNEAVRHAKRFPHYNELSSAAQAAVIDMTYNMGANWWNTKFPELGKILKEPKLDIRRVIEEIKYKNSGETTLYYRQVGNRAKENIAAFRGMLDQQKTVAANTPTGIVDRSISSLDQKFGEFMKVFTVENLEKAFGKAIVNGFRKPQSVNTNFVVGGRG